MDYFSDVLTTFLDHERGSYVASMEGQKALGFHQPIKQQILRVWNDMRVSN